VRAHLCYPNNLLFVNDLGHNSEAIAANVEDDQAFDIISAVEGPLHVDQFTPSGRLNLFDPLSEWNSRTGMFDDESVDSSTVFDYHRLEPFI
jgi:hypothetical protein